MSITEAQAWECYHTSGPGRRARALAGGEISAEEFEEIKRYIQT